MSVIEAIRVFERSNEKEIYWIPAVGQDQEKKSSFRKIEYLIKGFDLDKGKGDERLLEEAIATFKHVLSPASVMTRVKAGSFQMGNIENDARGHSGEKPVGKVTLTYDFWLGRYPVTFWEYDSFCAATNQKRPNDDGMGRGPRPVVNVSWWYEAILFCNWLSQREGLAPAYEEIGNLLDSKGNRTTDLTVVEGYRLPTEAEWEYAARGGHKGSRSFMFAGSDYLDEVGWYDQNTSTEGRRRSPQPVGKKKANELGIFDMSGNVSEWCHDQWRDYLLEPQINPVGVSLKSSRVVRSGSAGGADLYCRVARRGVDLPYRKHACRGFRVARTIR